MATFKLDFVSQDHSVFTGDVSEVIAPGVDGQLAVLARHAPLMTVLSPGEVVVRASEKEDQCYAISGGWMEVRPDHVTILARTAERSDEIDLKRAEAAMARAAELLAHGVPQEDRAGLDMAFRRSQIRLKVGRKRTGWRPSGPTDLEDSGS